MSKKTKCLSKKIKMITVVLIILIISIIILVNLFNKKVIFIQSTYNWYSMNYGYKIYDNGIIEEYDDYNSDAKLKRAKISKEELSQLKKLANAVEDNYVDANSFKPGSIEAIILTPAEDANTKEEKIYNNKKNKWIILSQSGGTEGYNDTKESKEIIKLTNLLFEKYFEDNK